MANFGSKNETFAYLVGKDIAEIKAKIEGIGTTSGGLDVLKIIAPAATEEDVNNGAMVTVDLPDGFKNALVLVKGYGDYNATIIGDKVEFLADNIEKTHYIIKLTDFKNPKEMIHGRLKKSSSSVSDA